MHDVVIVGAGMAGLTCARALRAQGASCVVLEAGDAVGGRVRTDDVGGFRVDRGFQVLLTAYPTARRWLDYAGLGLGHFEPGALVATPEGEARVSDPFRRPGRLLETWRAPVGAAGDKLRIAVLRLAATAGGIDGVWTKGMAPDGAMRTTAAELAARGFTPAMLERFLRPWLGGVFLERDLATPAAMMFFVYRMFSQGYAALPTGGMQRIPEQLAAGLGPDGVVLRARVARTEPGAVELLDGQRVPARQIVVATDREEATRLVDEIGGAAWRGVINVQWAAPRSPLAGQPMLWLNGRGRGLINNLVVPSDVAAGYAPAGQALVSATVLGDAPDDDGELTRALGLELAERFGQEVWTWRPLAVRRIRRALPVVSAPGTGREPREVREGLWICGDHRASASIEGAMASGEATANTILARLGLGTGTDPRVTVGE